MASRLAITHENLSLEFVHKSTASLTHQAYAAAAEKEGYPQIAVLLRAVARSEAVQALSALTATQQVGGTRQNLETALRAAQSVAHELADQAVEAAVKERHAGAFLLRCARRCRSLQTDLLQQAIQAMMGNADLPQSDVYVCPVCGHVVVGVPQGKCPNCANRPNRYEKIP